MDTHITIPTARLIELETAEQERDICRSERLDLALLVGRLARSELVTCGGGLPGDPNGEQAALAVEGLVRKYEGAMLRERLREALSEAYLMGAQNILGQLR